MYRDYKIRPPFFEIGPKAYLYGDDMLCLALAIDAAAERYDVDVIVTPQYTDIRLLADNTRRIHIYAQHMDLLPVGRGLGSVLPEAVKAAGAVGVMLNHAEKKLTPEEIEKTIARADEVGLATIVCADTIEEIETVARMSPNLIVAEPTALIGTGVISDNDYITATIETVHCINRNIMVLQGAGIKNGDDVYNIIAAGAQATGSTSGIIKADDPAAMVDEMLSALRRSWDSRHPTHA